MKGSLEPTPKGTRESVLPDRNGWTTKVKKSQFIDLPNGQIHDFRESPLASRSTSQQFPTQKQQPTSQVSSEVPLIDLFAGPGGLSEGFSSFQLPNGVRPFKVALSIEKDTIAHQTLELRSFFRQFERKSPNQYFQYLRKEITRSELFAGFPEQARQAKAEAWKATLGEVPTAEVDRRITESLAGSVDWILIGGPPCQAYSMAGRSRNGGIDPEDKKVFLYKEYLRILAKYKPPIFVMENVKGLLSAKTKESKIFHEILRDLENPISALAGDRSTHRTLEYRVFSLVKPAVTSDKNGRPVLSDADFVIKCEDYGIPQARHRVILLGIKNDHYKPAAIAVLRKQIKISTKTIIEGLPRLRSGLSKTKDSTESWLATLNRIPKQTWFSTLDDDIKKRIVADLQKMKPPKRNRGAEFLPCSPTVGIYEDWYLDHCLRGVCNHSTRGHLEEDLFRYFFCAAYGKVKQKTPLLSEFPRDLLPAHENVMTAMEGSNFPDRFRVQIGGRCATTITSHISKDGHYYIHHDPTQCRSFTVREAARLQTFPDNYFFEGPRTSQYGQVGNAVPPLLARQIAEVAWQAIETLRTKRREEPLPQNHQLKHNFIILG